MSEPVIPERNATRSIGFWMALTMGLFQGIAAVRAVADPVAFSNYMGLPIETAEQTGFVLVYALRTAFIACLVVAFCVRRQLEPLMWMALLAVALPVGDALLAGSSGAPAATIARHLAIAVFVLVTFFLLRRSHHAMNEPLL